MTGYESKKKAAQDKLAQTAQEPWCMKMNGCNTKCEDCPDEAALAQPAQEPVAHFGSAYVNENGVHITTVLGPVAIPQDAKLYTTPPQRPWVDLTKDEKQECVNKSMYHTAWSSDVDLDTLIDAVGAMLKEKNS
jgi:hypothetical protein